MPTRILLLIFLLYACSEKKQSNSETAPEMCEVAPDKKTIGTAGNSKSYTHHEISLMPGDCLYLFTDGYADQFGGISGKNSQKRNCANFS